MITTSSGGASTGSLSLSSLVERRMEALRETISNPSSAPASPPAQGVSVATGFSRNSALSMTYSSQGKLTGYDPFDPKQNPLLLLLLELLGIDADEWARRRTGAGGASQGETSRSPQPVLAAGFSGQGGAAELEFNIGDTTSDVTARRVQWQVSMGDPLVLDLSGEGVKTTGFERGVQFDLTGDGRTERMSTVAGNTWFLALDANHNGQIDNGRELFGDQNGAANGFAELARHDDDGNGRIDADDRIFSRLRLLQLGAGGAQVMRALGEAGIERIELGYSGVDRALDTYDRIAQTGRFIRTDGSSGTAADVLLSYLDSV